MSTLLEVLKGIETFKADMEELGVDVTVSAVAVARGGMKKPSVTVVSIFMPELEDLEAEG